MKISVKLTSKQPVNVEIDNNASIQDLKASVAKEFQCEASELTLIFKGKVLKNDQSLESYSIQEGSVVHSVLPKKTETPPQHADIPTQASPAMPSQAPQHPAAQPSIPGLPAFGDMNMDPQQAFDMLSQNPFLREMASQMFKNPEVLRQQLASSPEFQRLAESNPEVAAMMNDDAVLNQVSEAISNPQIMQELMRQADMNINQLADAPGGMTQINRLNNTINSSLNGSGNPWGSLGNIGGLATASDTATANPFASSDTSAPAQPSTALPSQFSADPPSSFAINPAAMMIPEVREAYEKYIEAMNVFGKHNLIPEEQKNMFQLMQDLGNISSMMRPSTTNQTSAPQGQSPQPAQPQLSVAELKVKYTEEIKKLKEIGFTNEDDMATALEKFQGNVAFVANYLLDNGSM